MNTLPIKLEDALLINRPLVVRFGGGKTRYLVFTFLPHGVRKVLPCMEGPQGHGDGMQAASTTDTT